MVGDSDLADVVLWAEGERFPVHRVILEARSEYFRAASGNGAGGNGEEEAAGQVLERAVLKATDMLRVEGLLEHCVEAFGYFGRGLKVKTAVEQLVWAYNHGPAEARTVATEYFARNGRRIRV